jgi:nitroreductase
MKETDVGSKVTSGKTGLHSAVSRAALTIVMVLAAVTFTQAQELKTIKLSAPDKERGFTVGKSLSLRASVREWSDRDVTSKDLSDLLWAANGINRDNGRRTAGSAQNAQDVDVYVFMKDGVYLYDAKNHALNPVASGDHRTDIGMARPAGAGGPGATAGQPGASPAGASAQAPAAAQGQAGSQPAGAAPAAGQAPQGGNGKQSNQSVILLLVSDNSRFGGGTDQKKFEWGAVDSGLVGQNVMLFCAGNGLVTHPRASIDDARMKTLLNLKDTQHAHLELPIGYPKE